MTGKKPAWSAWSTPARPVRRLFQLHMSETIHQRQALIRGILANIVIPQLLLLLIAVGAVWYALKQGLEPLERLRQDVARRHRDDLSRLDETQAPAEVRPLIDAVNDLLERLKQVMQSQKRFVADAAHQLRTPFAGLKTQAELALRESEIGAQAARAGTDTHQRQAQHSSGEPAAGTGAQRTGRTGRRQLRPARSQPAGAGMHGALGAMALEKNIDLGFEGIPVQAPVRGDADSLTEMLGNLIDNAIRYTQAGGHITVSVDYQQGGAVLRVEDNGPGIAPQHRERVFERFYRILGSGQSGSGLGLAIVAEVAKRHGATIVLRDGQGGKGHWSASVFPITAANL